MSGALRRGIPTSRAALFGAITKAKNFEILPCDRHFPPSFSRIPVLSAKLKSPPIWAEQAAQSHHGDHRGCQAAEADQVPSGVQSEGGHDQGQH